MNKIINILKPTGMTSHDVVSCVRRTLNMKKVGHTGTLDPDAAGVLPICLGRATKVSELILNKDKSYISTTAINGAKNAALIAVSILALQDAALAAKLDAFRAKQTADVLKAEI